jgi:hypothetical protein
VIGKRRDFLAPLAQRRQMEPDDVQAVEEVFAEPALGHQRVQIGVGGGDDPDVDAVRLRVADRVHFAGLEKAEQLGLHVEAHVADFVEEQGAARGRANDALEVVGRAGERSAAMAEQLRIEHVLRGRGAVEGEEGRLGAVGIGVNRPRENFLAGPCFTGDQHGHVRRRHPARRRDQRLHLVGNE